MRHRWSSSSYSLTSRSTGDMDLTAWHQSLPQWAEEEGLWISLPLCLQERPRSTGWPLWELQRSSKATRKPATWTTTTWTRRCGRRSKLQIAAKSNNSWMRRPSNRYTGCRWRKTWSRSTPDGSEGGKVARQDPEDQKQVMCQRLPWQTKSTSDNSEYDCNSTFAASPGVNGCQEEAGQEEEDWKLGHRRGVSQGVWLQSHSEGASEAWSDSADETSHCVSPDERLAASSRTISWLQSSRTFSSRLRLAVPETYLWTQWCSIGMAVVTTFVPAGAWSPSQQAGWELCLLEAAEQG